MGSVSDAMLLAAESGPHLPSVSDFLPPEILFEGTPFAINRIILVRLVATVIMLTVLIITARAPRSFRAVGRLRSNGCSITSVTTSSTRSWGRFAVAVTCR